MHNNSLRPQPNHHSRPPARLRKNNQPTTNESNLQPQKSDLQNKTTNINNCDQHSELKWLEKVVYDMKRYQIAPERQPLALSPICQPQVGAENVLKERMNCNPPTNIRSSQAKEQSLQKKTQTKIKFEILPHKENKENKQPRKSSNKAHPLKTQKKVEETTSKTHKHKPQKSQPPSKQQQIVLICPDITQTYNSMQTLGDAENLWTHEKMNRQENHQNRSQSQQRTSAGKIIKNQRSHSSTQYSSSLNQTYNSKMQTNSSKKAPKVYIKLQTQNLSKYLSENESKENHNHHLLSTEQYSKLCPPTKRYPLCLEKNSSLILMENSEASPSGKTKKIQTNSNVVTNMITINPSEQQQSAPMNFVNKIKVKTIEQIEQEIKVLSRSKSQQRKLNKAVKQKIDNKQEKIQQNAEEKNKYSTNQQTLLIQKDQQERQILKEQKLFTLSEDQPLSISHSSNPPKEEPLNYESVNINQIQTHNGSTTKNTNNSYSLEQQQLPIMSISLQNNYDRQLSLLFSFLDQSKRGLLTSSNCRVQGLTEELKLLFSSIIHQIRTKKRAYSLQKFIKQSTNVLQIKQEVYSANDPQSNIIPQILKENLEILRKKSPLEFATHTLSQFNTNSNSKRNSLSQNDSIVIAKLLMREQTPKQRSTFSCASKLNLDELNLQEPQLFFKKKYSIPTSQHSNLSLKQANESCPSQNQNSSLQF